MPALTNPNNVSIATGRPPRFHGISGNYIWDAASGAEVLMNDKRFLRIPTLFAAANEAGHRLERAVALCQEGGIESGWDPLRRAPAFPVRIARVRPEVACVAWQKGNTLERNAARFQPVGDGAE